MKGYLFGLGAMLVGAGLMFVLMHGEVRADDHNKSDIAKQRWLNAKSFFHSMNLSQTQQP
jgi:hypothetical protein